MQFFYIYCKKKLQTVFHSGHDFDVSVLVNARLTHLIVDRVNHKQLFDNWETLVDLMTFLKYKVILCLGIIKRNLIPCIKISPDN